MPVSVNQKQVKNKRISCDNVALTNNLDTFLCPASGFQRLCTFFNAEVRMLLNFISIVLVPSGSTPMWSTPLRMRKQLTTYPGLG